MTFCLRFHRQWLHVRFLTPSLRFLWCSKCGEIR